MRDKINLSLGVVRRLSLITAMTAVIGCGAAKSTAPPPRLPAASTPAESPWERRFREACGGHDARACANFAGRQLRRATRGPGAQDAQGKRVVKALQRACDLGAHQSCGALGSLLWGGGLMRDRPRALKLWELACERGEMESCLAAASGHETVKPPNWRRAAELYQKSCDAGLIGGCSGLGTAYMIGLGVARDKAKAVRLWRRACDGLHGPGCRKLGHAYVNGDGVRASEETALRLFQKGCHVGGSPPSCRQAGALLQRRSAKPKPRALATAYAHLSCRRGGRAQACASYPDLSTLDVPRLEARCDRHDSSACVIAAIAWALAKRGVQKPDLAKSARLYLRGCALHNGAGCLNLGQMFRLGEAVKQDHGKAFALYKWSCLSLWHGRSCTEYSIALQQGKGTPVDREEAKRMMNRACDLGSEIACKNAGRETPVR